MNKDPRPRRAAPMSPEERRLAIVRATVELLRERGPNVTTRDLADAAGVAEGTLFRVFPDKTALICAAIDHAMNPEPTLGELASIPTTTGLREALTRAVEIMLERSRAVGSLLPVLHELRRHDDTGHGEPGHAGQGHGGPGHDGQGHGGPGHGPSKRAESSAHGAHPGRGSDSHHGPGAPHGRGWHGGPHPVEAVIEAVAALLRPHRDRLRHSPETCARMLVALIMVSTRPMGFGRGLALSAEELTALFLDGALDPTEETPC